MQKIFIVFFWLRNFQIFKTIELSFVQKYSLCVLLKLSIALYKYVLYWMVSTTNIGHNIWVLNSIWEDFKLTGWQIRETVEHQDDSHPRHFCCDSHFLRNPFWCAPHVDISGSGAVEGQIMPDPRFCIPILQATVNQRNVCMCQEMEAYYGEDISIGVLAIQQVTQVTCKRERSTVVKDTFSRREGSPVKVVKNTWNHALKSFSANRKAANNYLWYNRLWLLCKS